jgi:hypothetical protein
MIGQSRILISIAKNICSSQISNNKGEEIKQSRDGEDLVFIHRVAFFSADSTLREVMDYIMVQHSLVVVRDTECKFFDCTAYPPKELIFNTRNDQLIGPNSVTLQSLGWFPSGTIVVTHAKDHSAHHTILNVSKISTLELGTFQDATSVDYGGAVQKRNDVAKLLPSQIFTDVALRFQSQGDEEQQQITTSHFRNQKKKEEAMQKQLKQNQKLLTMIKNLEDKQQNKKKRSSNQTNITSQVRKMLIKSRSVGDNENLRQEDRFFLEVIVITQCDDSLENNSSTSVAESMYCFFSQMDTVGKVASSCLSKVTTAQATATSLGGTATTTSKTSPTPLLLEFLVLKPTASKESDTNDDNNYKDENATLWRVPNTMTLIDCQRQGLLQNFERIIIRRYYGTNVDFAAPCIMEWLKIGGSYSPMEVSDDIAVKNVVQESNTSNLNSFQDDNSNSFNNYFVSNEEEERIIRFEKALSHIFSSSNSTSTTSSKNATKKSTNTMEKVRQMQMKSKAQGNKRSIPEEDRYYLQIIHFYDDDTFKSNTVHTACHFFSMQRSKAIDVIACCSSGVDSTIYSSELLIRTDKPRVYYYKFPDDMTLKEAEEKGFLKQFSHVFIRSFKKN